MPSNIASISGVPSIAPGHRIRRVQDGQHAPWDRRDLRGRPASGVETLEPFPGLESARRPRRRKTRWLTELGLFLGIALFAVAAILIFNLQ
jgi:hypothetical protein